MVLRLSSAQAKKLGIAPPVKKKTRSPKSWSHEELVGQNTINISFPIAPYTKDRPRTFLPPNVIRSAFMKANGSVEVFMKNIKMKTITTGETREFEGAVSSYTKAFMTANSLKVLEGPVLVSVVFKIPGNASCYPVAQQDGDLDNHEKAFFDALNGIVYSDDKMIVKKYSDKVYTGGQGEIEFFACSIADLNTSQAIKIISDHLSTVPRMM